MREVTHTRSLEMGVQFVLREGGKEEGSTSPSRLVSEHRKRIV